MKSTDQFQTYEVPWEEFIAALREEMKKQVGADIVDTVVCNLEDGFEVYTYVQGIWILNIRKRWKGNTGVMQKLLTC